MPGFGGLTTGACVRPSMVARGRRRQAVRGEELRNWDEMRSLNILAPFASEILLTSDGVEVPLLSLALSLPRGDEDFEKPRWVSLSSREWNQEVSYQTESKMKPSAQQHVD